MKATGFLLSIAVPVAFSLLLGCGSSPTGVMLTPSPDVYVAGGTFNSQNLETAVYWKNGTVTTLGNPGDGSAANAIAVSGNDVYVAGIEGIHNNVAKYWKNGVPVALTDGTHNASANAIAISSGNVYVAGSEDDGEQVANFAGEYNGVAKYWKNGNEVRLSDGTQNASANAIFISGNDIYVAGSTLVTIPASSNSSYGTPIATLWKNGVAMYLTDGLHLSDASAVYVSGTDVYVAGFAAQTAQKNDAVATLWKNGAPITLSTAIGSAATSVSVAGQDVYVAGQSSSGAAYWKNGVAVPLAGTAASQIAVVGNDIYVAGNNFPKSSIYGNAVRDAAGNSNVGALVWQNGNFVSLSPSYSNANSISVVNH